MPRLSAPRSNSWLATIIASVPMALSTRTSASPEKKLKMGAPWKQSPPSRCSTRSARGAADVDDRAGRPEAEAGVDLAELQVVREEARVDVRRVDERQVHLALEL